MPFISPPAAKLADLHPKLVDAFSEDELKTLCLKLDIRYDRLAGEGLDGKARELLALLDRAGRIEELVALCAAERPNVAWAEALPTDEAKSPFKGLEYYDVGDWSLFYGREALTVRLVEHLAGRRLLVVVGASGSGKSSVVRAGLVHAVQEGGTLAGGRLPPQAGGTPFLHIITPGAHPLETLAASLTRDAESVRATQTLIDDLAAGPSSLHLYARRLLAPCGSDARMLVVVDQFEELFTLCRSEDERKAFIDNLLYAAGDDTGGPTAAVITLRADFYAHCGQYENLRAALERDQVYAGPMTEEELREAIERPARARGWEFETGLVDVILRDAGSEPGALPLLSHALLETWKRREGRTLTLAGYAAAGGVGGAIAATADTLFAGLPAQEQTVARGIFLRLVEPGEGTQDTRRRAALSELAPRPEAAPAVEAMLKRLADARLVTTSQDSAEVAHEALIREWPALRGWLNEDREWLRLHLQLAEDAREWVTRKRDPGALYRGARLAVAAERAGKHGDQLNALEREFLEASQAEVEREAAEREAQRQRELQAAQSLAASKAQAAERLKARNRIITGVGALALVLAILAGILAVVANGKAGEAEANARTAFARQLAAQSVSRQGSDLALGLLLGAEAYRVESLQETRSGLLSALQSSPRLTTFLRSHKDVVLSVAFSPDGKTLASGSADRTMILWDVDPASWQARACQIANRNLTKAEWRQYLGAYYGDDAYRKTCEGLAEGE